MNLGGNLLFAVAAGVHGFGCIEISVIVQPCRWNHIGVRVYNIRCTSIGVCVYQLVVTVYDLGVGVCYRFLYAYTYLY